MEKNVKGLKAVIIGASGASGRELVKELIESPAWNEVAVIVRRVLDEWKDLPTAQQQKLKIILTPNLDDLGDVKKWDFKGYNSFFCCLGSRVQYGDDQFIKVDYTYPVNGGTIAKEMSFFKKKSGIPHYSIVSSTGADKTSMFLYMRTKGNVEEALSKLGLPYLSIFRPGGIIDRRNDDRFGEKIMKYIPFIPKIQAGDLSKALRIEAEKVHSGLQNDRKSTVIYENKDILNMLR